MFWQNGVEKIPINLEIIKKFETTAKNMQGKERDFAKELCMACQENLDKWNYYGITGKRSESLYNAYAALCGVSAGSVVDFDDFWNSKFEGVLSELFGSSEAKRLREVCALIFETPYSHDIYRPAYRSKRVCDHTERFFITIIGTIEFMSYEISLADALLNGFENNQGFFANRIALALREGEQEIIELVKEAISGDSGKIKLSHAIISGVIRSGISEWLELIGKLLIAAKAQEGLRQAILEKADCGSPQAHAYFIKLMIDNNLARFSSAIRAFDAWAGLAYDNAKPALIGKCLKLAYEYLSGEAQIENGLKSADTLEVYMAL
jgi:hypothetical protein